MSPGTESGTMPAAKIGLGVFLAVVGSLFALFISAYFMRMGLSDWRADAGAAAALAQHRRAGPEQRRAAMRAGRGAQAASWTRCRLGLVAGGLTALAFLVGQLMAWRELTADGYFLAANPANSFFYLITGMHGLHIVGGLVGAWPRPSSGPGRAMARSDRLRLSVELCAIYWHFLLFVWLALFVLLAGWAATSSISAASC